MGIINRIAPTSRLIGEMVQGPGSFASLSETMARMAGILGGWQDRARQRRQLAALDPRMLRDVGLTPADVETECRKLPWQS